MHSTNYFKSYSPTNEEADTPIAKPIIKSKSPMYMVDNGASLCICWNKVLLIRRTEKASERLLLGSFNRERGRPFHERGEGLHPGAQHLLVRDVGERFFFGFLFGTIMR